VAAEVILAYTPAAQLAPLVGARFEVLISWYHLQIIRGPQGEAVPSVSFG